MASQSQFHKTTWDVIKSTVHVGDVVWFQGIPGKTKTGELSLMAAHGYPVAPSTVPIPFKSGIQDAETKAKSRVMDLLVHLDLQHRLIARSKLIRALRHFLEHRGFVELDTPILSGKAGGATARPFLTQGNAGGELVLRVAPELYLKRLVIAGFDRVFEIGKQFRNEGIDATHQPEFTTCEFYQAYATLQDIMRTTEELLRELVRAVHGENHGLISVPLLGEGEEGVIIDFARPFNVIDVVPYLSERVGPLPDLEGPSMFFSSAQGVSFESTKERAVDAMQQMLQYCTGHNIPLPALPHTAPRLMDAVIAHVIEPKCMQPTFVTGHPRILSPLSKSMESDVSFRRSLYENVPDFV
jgi:lysyl-tRNA synthetase class 2